MLVVSLSFGIAEPIVTVALLCIALNLLLTGFFIVAVKQLTVERVAPSPQERELELVAP